MGNLVEFRLYRCALGNERIDALTSALSRCTNLSTLAFVSCNIDDKRLVKFMSRCRGLTQLVQLFLDGSSFGKSGCEALAALLRDTNSNLGSLVLSRNHRIDDKCATVLAHSLEENSKLEELVLSNCAITTSGLDTFSNLLCDSSNVEATFRSNHALSNLGNINAPMDLTSLLDLNRGPDKEHVGIEKILRSHPHFDIQIFLHWGLDLEESVEWYSRVLPLAVSWFDRASRYAQTEASTLDAEDVRARKLSVIYQFIRELPNDFFAPSSSKGEAVRTRHPLR